MEDSYQTFQDIKSNWPTGQLAKETRQTNDNLLNPFIYQTFRLPQWFDGVTPEARETSIQHETDQGHYLLLV